MTEAERPLDTVPVRVVDLETFRAHRQERLGTVLTEAWLQWQDGGYPGFMWECPGCGHAYWGELSETAVSGWEHPQWVNTGTREQPTLTPSLGCPLWREGRCVGHWWLRDGVLHRA